jgi:thioredoxin-like negative regulator of GroEL
LTYDDLRKRADQAVELVARRRMPPWPPDDRCGPFVGERRLSEEQINLLRRWANGGTPAGDPHDMPPAPQFSDDWKLGRPDLVVQSPEPFMLPAEGPDVYQNFVMPLRLAERRTVRAVEFRSGNPPVVHHVFFLLDPSGAGRRRASRESSWTFGGIHPGDGISSVSGRSLSWRPGSPACLDTSDAPWLLPAGADIVLQAHLRPSGKPEPVQPEVGLYFTDDPPVDSLVNLQVRSTSIDIPPGQRDYEIHDSYTMPVAVEILCVSAHAHYLGTDLQGFATLPDGTRRMLLRIPHWDFGLQGDYVLERGVTLPPGTKLEMSFHYDNSADNAQNPSSPPRRVRYGLSSDDEMGEFWVQLRTPNPADLKVLMADYHRRWMIPETIRQHQVMLARNPDDADRHARLGVVLLEAGRKKDGMAELQTALKLDEHCGRAHRCLASLLLAQGDNAQAAKRFRQAVAADPTDAGAQADLGLAIASMGQLAEGAEQLRAALVLDPFDALTHVNLARVLHLQGKTDDARDELAQALKLDPQQPLARETARMLAAPRVKQP